MSNVTTVSTGQVWLPGAEFVTVKFSSGDTYKSKKFKKIDGVVSSGLQNATTTTDSLTISVGTTDTITLISNTAATSLQASLIIWGRR